MGIEVYDLRRKFQLLKAYGCIDSLEEIAEKVGRKEKTLWGWADGTATTQPNQIPLRNFNKFQSAFAKALQDYVSPERGSELLLAPASHLENELRRSQATSLVQLTEEEAEANAMKVITVGSPGRGLIESQLDRDPKGQIHEVQKEQWFRMLIEADLSAYNVVSLQNGSGLWGPVPWSVDPHTGYLHLPGPHLNGEPAYMRERNSLGMNLFLVMATKNPLPTFFETSKIRRHTLETTHLASLADFYSQQKKSARRIFAAYISIE